MKKIYSLFSFIGLLIIGLLILTACDVNVETNKPVKLKTPVVTLNDNTASWIKIDNAIKYEISVNGTILELEKDLVTIILNDKETFKIKAIGDGVKYKDSDWSNSVTYEKVVVPPSLMLETPVVTLSSNGIASWEPVLNATGYACKINAATISYTSNLSITLSNNDTLVVMALGDNVNYANSDWSNSVTYKEDVIIELTKLETPVITLASDGNATWEKVNNAIKYEVCLNGEFFYVDSTSVGIKLEYEESLKIRAIGDGVTFESSDWSNSVIYKKPELSIGEQIEQEYNALKNGSTTMHTTWEFSGVVVDMSATSYSSTYGNYMVKMILDVDGVLIGIYNGYVDGTYPKSIVGLSVGTMVLVTGQINEDYTLTSGSYTANIEFANPEISWEKEDVEGDVNFLMINDTHGAFTDSSAGYSIGRVDTLVDNLTNRNGDYILIHNGDAFQGSYVCGETYGLPMIEALNTIGFDCFVLGNHEFDWGIDKIAQYADGNMANGEANFPFLGANIYYKGTTNRPEWIDPYTIVEYGSLKIGIIGVIGATQESSILTRYVEDYEFVDPINIIEENAKILRTTEACDVVVVATHDYDEYLNDAIASLSGNAIIDAIFCGHTHQLISESVLRSDDKTIAVVQNNHKNVTASEVIITLDENGDYEGYTSNIYSPSSYEISSDISILINQYSDLIDEANEVLGTTDYGISRSHLGAYAINMMLSWDYSEYDFGDIDVSIINTGGVRATIDAGEITRADVFEVFPFNNMVVLVNISGALIKSLYDNNSSYLYIDVVDEIDSYVYLDDNTIYQLAVIDYVFEGTYYYQFDNLTEDDYIQTDIILRDQLIYFFDFLY